MKSQLSMFEWEVTCEAVQMAIKNVLGGQGKSRIDELRAYTLMWA